MIHLMLIACHLWWDNMKRIIASIILSLFLISVYSVVPAEAGCVKTIQHRKYDSRGKLKGFSYERIYSRNCSGTR